MDDHIKRVRGALLRGAAPSSSTSSTSTSTTACTRRVWKDNRRRHAERTRRVDVHAQVRPRLQARSSWATRPMSPYELEQPGGSVEHWNDEPGASGSKRMLRARGRAPRGCNPVPEEHWGWTTSIQNVQRHHGGAYVSAHDRPVSPTRDEVSRHRTLAGDSGHQTWRIGAPASYVAETAIDRDVDSARRLEARTFPVAHAVRSTPRVASRNTSFTRAPWCDISDPRQASVPASASQRPGAAAARCTTSRAQTCRPPPTR